jgi:LmbE family N-acetylglucosaminyl deacetylase
MNVLVIAGHPDDEVLGCGATIARLVNEGNKVYVVILGEGITSRYDKGNPVIVEELEKLRNNSREVSELLGVEGLFVYNLPDNQFDTIPLLTITKKIESIIGEVQPSVVYTHFIGDLNIDHSLVSRATITATRPVAGNSVKRVYMYEVPSSTEWSFGHITVGFQANVFVDVKDTLSKKMEAMSIYEGEMRSFPHPRSAEALRAAAMRWGYVSGLEAAEAFCLVREIL